MLKKTPGFSYLGVVSHQLPKSGTGRRGMKAGKLFHAKRHQSGGAAKQKSPPHQCAVGFGGRVWALQKFIFSVAMRLRWRGLLLLRDYAFPVEWISILKTEIHIYVLTSIRLYRHR